MQTVTTIRADRVEPGMHLVTDYGTAWNIGPTVSAVETVRSFTAVRTWNGGKINYPNGDRVTVMFGTGIPENGQTLSKA